jgi:two-component system chemotaxis response regulator CheY
VAITTKAGNLCQIIQATGEGVTAVDVTAILKAMPKGQQVILDFTPVQKLQLAVVQPLVQAASEAKKLGAPFLLAANETLAASLKAQGLDQLFKIYPTLAAAQEFLDQSTTTVMLAMPAETRFLIVDKSKVNRDVLKQQLEGFGFKRVVLVETAAEAFKLVKSLHRAEDPVGFVLAEWELPEMTGLQLLDELRNEETFRELPFILLASAARPEQLAEATEFGMTACLIRPIAPDKLLATLNDGWRKHNSTAESQFWDM